MKCFKSTIDWNRAKTEYTLSELIELLENAREQEGDVPVRLCRADGALFYLPEMSFGVGYKESD